MTRTKKRIDPASVKLAVLAVIAYAPLLAGVFGGLAWAVVKAVSGRWLAAVGVFSGSAVGGAALTFACVGLSHLLEGLVPDGGA